MHRWSRIRRRPLNSMRHRDVYSEIRSALMVFCNDMLSMGKTEIATYRRDTPNCGEFSTGIVTHLNRYETIRCVPYLYIEQGSKITQFESYRKKLGDNARWGTPPH